MAETRLVAMTAEDAARLRLIADHEGNDLSPNDHGLLLALADARFDDGITEQEARLILYGGEGGARDRATDKLYDSLLGPDPREGMNHERDTPSANNGR